MHVFVYHPIRQQPTQVVEVIHGIWLHEDRRWDGPVPDRCRLIFGQSALPMNKVIAKELELIRWGVDALVHGRIDIGLILSEEFPLANAIGAFELASDRSKAMKVSLMAND